MGLLNHLLNEKHETMLIDISLAEIIAAGKITNYYHTFLLTSLLTAMPHCHESALGKPCESIGNEVELTEYVKSLSDADVVKIATCLLSTINFKNQFPSPSIDMVDWMRYVIRKQ